MGHGKLRKFAENATFGCLVQPFSEEVIESGEHGLVLRDYSLKGHWNEKMFDAPRPIVLELGCGRGEYTIDLAQRNPACNYIGVDIKGARLWRGAKYAHEHEMGNVAFLRTRIEFIEAFFAPGEISEIWLTFSDPQLKSENSRLTCPRFLERYRKFLAPGGVVHLKTDSMFLHQYSKAVAQANGLEILRCTEDLYGSTPRFDEPALYEVQTYYERMFLQMGLKITYLSYRIDHEGPYAAPEFDAQKWRALEGPRRTFDHQPASNKVQ
ncbi:MAG: tRNA (guanosine(46)-N7)-methyltransferase TrmB [Bacteroidales bacterium]|nr:tRNA (guanosine(46)-N7)-methyltransferase TrmB [Bacteroidales bacterium]